MHEKWKREGNDFNHILETVLLWPNKYHCVRRDIYECCTQQQKWKALIHEMRARERPTATWGKVGYCETY